MFYCHLVQFISEAVKDLHCLVELCAPAFDRHHRANNLQLIADPVINLSNQLILFACPLRDQAFQMDFLLFGRGQFFYLWNSKAKRDSGGY